MCSPMSDKLSAEDCSLLLAIDVILVLFRVVRDLQN